MPSGCGHVDGSQTNHALLGALVPHDQGQFGGHTWSCQTSQLSTYSALLARRRQQRRTTCEEHVPGVVEGSCRVSVDEQYAYWLLSDAEELGEQESVVPLGRGVVEVSVVAAHQSQREASIHHRPIYRRRRLKSVPIRRCGSGNFPRKVSGNFR